jgi:hypothetical protein
MAISGHENGIIEKYLTVRQEFEISDGNSASIKHKAIACH